MGSRSASQGQTGSFRHSDAGDWGVDALVRISGDQRCLGRCVADLVAAGSGRPGTGQTPGDLLGQRPEELRPTDTVLETDGAVCGLVGAGDSTRLLSSLPQ